MSRDETQVFPIVGFLGLGTMGGHMARRLLDEGFPVLAYDPEPEKLQACLDAGAAACENEEGVASAAHVVLCSLRLSSQFVQVAEGCLIPAAHKGQVFLDLGTTAPGAIRRLAPRFAEAGASLLDAPVSGGVDGAESGMLRIFVGGEEEVFEQCRGILEVLGNPERVVYCGPSGAGAVMKGVNQLAMGLGWAARLEAVAFGVLAGVDPLVISEGVGGPEGWRAELNWLARRAAQGAAEGVLCHFPELPYWLEEAGEQGFDMPMTRALYSFLKDGDIDFKDNMGRPCASFWNELMKRGEVDLGKKPPSETEDR
jgi:3-hydroxyisobutyrate dehydrogenase-like beta-hydroxyacid dehydrogenase